MINYFDDKGLDYTEGPAKNVTGGWVGIRCPFPGCKDHSNHCGIRLEDLYFTCYVCGETGYAVKLIKELERCTYKEAKGIAKKFRLDTGSYIPTTTRTPPTGLDLTGVQSKSFNYPDDIVFTKKRKTHRKYLRGRGFDPYYIWDKYGLQATMHLGRRFRFRVIIPVTYQGRVVTFTSRDITERQELKYQHCSDEESLVPIKSLLYGGDRIGKRVILVEGPLDQWKIGDGSCAILTTSMTDEQVLRLIEAGVEEVFILLDSGEQKKAKRLESKLAGVFPYVERITMDKGDPASALTNTNLNYLRRIIDGKS